jgi:hypothetical protein
MTDVHLLRTQICCAYLRIIETKIYEIDCCISERQHAHTHTMQYQMDLLFYAVSN